MHGGFAAAVDLVGEIEEFGKPPAPLALVIALHKPVPVLTCRGEFATYRNRRDWRIRIRQTRLHTKQHTAWHANGGMATRVYNGIEVRDGCNHGWFASSCMIR